MALQTTKLDKFFKDNRRIITTSHSNYKQLYNDKFRMVGRKSSSLDTKFKTSYSNSAYSNFIYKPQFILDGGNASYHLPAYNPL